MSILPCMLPLRPILVMLLTICCSMGVGSLCRAADANDAADIRTPLLQEGKRTLYQRVISHPGARLADADPLDQIRRLLALGQGSDAAVRGPHEPGSRSVFPQF